MYQNWYNFIQKPFDVTPDPRFLYMSRNHEETLATIIYGIRERRGFITIIGEVGTGKTTLLNATLEQLDDQTLTAFIFNTDVHFEELLHMALVDFGLSAPEESLSKSIALDRLNHFATEQFSAGKNIVIIIDEAQNLNLNTMENLRLLSNLETPKNKLVQIVLSGQPELDEKLRRQELRQLAQRINLRRYITPLDKEDTFHYIQHHLQIAGCPDPKIFDKPSLELIWSYSGGIPRKINILCDNALLIGFGLGKKKITRSIIQEAINDLSWSPFSKPPPPLSETKPNQIPVLYKTAIPRIAAATAVMFLAVMIGVAGVLFWKSESEIPKPISQFSRTGPIASTHPPPQAAPTAMTPLPTDSRQELQAVLSKPEPDIPDRATKGSVSVPSISAPPLQINPANITDAESEVSPQVATQETSNDNSFDLIVVRKGDSLSGIIENHFGNFEKMLPLVLQENTQIRDPNRIIPGWVIRLPRSYPNTEKTAEGRTNNRPDKPAGNDSRSSSLQ